MANILRIFLVAGLILMSLNVSADVTKEELRQALSESTTLLEEQTTLNERLQNRIEEFQTQVNNYQELVSRYPILIDELKTEFSETRTSFQDYKDSVDEEIQAYQAELDRQRMFIYLGFGFGSGAIAGAMVDKPLEGAAIGGVLGFGVYWIDRLVIR